MYLKFIKFLKFLTWTCWVEQKSSVLWKYLEKQSLMGWAYWYQEQNCSKPKVNDRGELWLAEYKIWKWTTIKHKIFSEIQLENESV